MANRGAGLLMAACVALWGASCTEDGSDGDAVAAAGEAGASDSPLAGSAGHAGSQTSTDDGGAGNGATAGSSSGQGGAAPSGAGMGGDAMSLAGDGQGSRAGEGGMSVGGAGGEGGAGGGFVCDDDQFAVVGEPVTCVDCGTYHYTAYPPDIYEVCAAYGTHNFYDRPTRKLYIEGKAGLPVPKSWTLTSDPFSSGLRLYTVPPPPPCGICVPPEGPACALNPFSVTLSVSGKYLVAEIPEAAAACAESAGTPIEGWVTWSGIDYGCAGHVGINNSIFFKMNLEATQIPAGLDCVNNSDLPPKKVDGP